MNRIVIFLGFVVIALLGMILVQYRLNVKISNERNRYKENTHAMLSDIVRMQIDSTTMAVDVKTLKLTIDEFERYRAADMEQIKKLNIRLKSVQSVAKHTIEVEADIKAELIDTLVIRDTVTVQLKKVELNTPHLQVNGIIEGNSLVGKIHLPVTLHQVVWTEPKHKFLWWKWGVKAIHQTISSDNPHVQIKYSEMIRIEK